MYDRGYYGYRRFRWIPILLAFIFVLAIFTGGFHRPFFFFWPLFFVFPFFFVIGAAVLFMLFAAHRWHGGYRQHQRGDFFDGWDGEKRKRHEHDNGDNSDIFYV